ncbi:MAG: mechanosensitive ion channel domain-containing protein [Burkholderiales bacterium]
MEGILDWLGAVRHALEVPLFDVGDSQVTLWTLAYILVLIVVLFYATSVMRALIVRRLLARTSLDRGAREAAGTVTRYIVLLIGLLIIVQTAGINLTTLNVLAGAVGIGVGFGLQNVVNNFFSGLIVMFERPIKIGDRIEVDGIDGDVIEIGARSTKVLTNDNIAIIVPNSKFITENVVNWKYSDDVVRFRIPVSVAYGSDARKVEKLLLEVAEADEDVLENPPPAVRLIEFGDNGLEFELRAWTSTQTHRKGKLFSSLNFGIYEKFNENDIEFPFPQRDLHVRGGPLEVSVTGKGKETSK